MALEASVEPTRPVVPLGDNVRDAVAEDANPRVARTLPCLHRARADSSASRRCSLLRAAKGESLFVASRKIASPEHSPFIFYLLLQGRRCRGRRWRWRCQRHGAGAVPSSL